MSYIRSPRRHPILGGLPKGRGIPFPAESVHLAGPSRVDSMTTTIVKVSRKSAGRESLLRALRNAGVGVVEVGDWKEARERLAGTERAVLVCDSEGLDGDASGITRAIAALGESAAGAAAMPPDAMRTLSHELRTPLSAMAGWLHLMETGKLDEAGLQRASSKLRGNIEDQVRTLDRYLGNSTREGRS